MFLLHLAAKGGSIGWVLVGCIVGRGLRECESKDWWGGIPVDMRGEVFQSKVREQRGVPSGSHSGI